MLDLLQASCKYLELFRDDQLHASIVPSPEDRSHDSSLFSSSDVFSAYISVMLLEPWKEIEVV